MPMPEWIRDAILAQGKVDPDEVERLAELVDLDAPRGGPEQIPLPIEPEPER